MSVAILDGFKQSIEKKLTGFASHITVTNHDANYSYQANPIEKNEEIENKILKIQGVKHIQAIAIKAGLVKTMNDTYGVVLKGVGADYDWSFIEENIVRGNHFVVPQKETKPLKDVVISEEMAKKFNVDTGSYIYMYFIEEQTRMRKYKVVGIYNSSLSEFDKIYIYADIHDIERLNNWNYKDKEQFTGYEILINDFKKLDKVALDVNRKVGFRFDNKGNKLKISTIKELYPQIFDWLSLLNMNAAVLLIIMFFVASINMITALLILILERTNMIGLLKAIGSTNKSIRKIFIFNGLIILLKGLIWGNLITFAIILLQHYTHFIPLNPQIYYINYVPFSIDITKILLINIGMIILTFLVLLLPSMFITKIDPVKAIKFN